MKTADEWTDQEFGEPWQLTDSTTMDAAHFNKLIRRIQADAMRHVVNTYSFSYGKYTSQAKQVILEDAAKLEAP